VKKVIDHTDSADQTGITMRYEGKPSPAALFVEATQHINWHEELDLSRMTVSKRGVLWASAATTGSR